MYLLATFTSFTILQHLLYSLCLYVCMCVCIFITIILSIFFNHVSAGYIHHAFLPLDFQLPYSYYVQDIYIDTFILPNHSDIHVHWVQKSHLYTFL